MGKKLIKVMDTSFRDGFQSVYGARVFVDDFIPALKSAVEAGIRHFETAGGARFQSPIFYCNENSDVNEVSQAASVLEVISQKEQEIFKLISDYRNAVH